jgi:hypothetical protein
MQRKYPATRVRKISVVLTSSEYEKLETKMNQSTCRSLSEYIRSMIFQQPITTYYRSQSVDEFLPIALALKNSLNEVMSVFGESVKSLQGLRAPGQGNIEFYEASHFSLSQKIEEIRTTLIKIYQSCTQI